MGTQPLPKKRVELPPQFSAHFYCGQTAGWIKMPLGTEVGLSPGNFVLDVDSASSTSFLGGAPPKKEVEPPQFLARVYCILAKRLDASRCHLVYRVRPRPRRLCVTWGPRTPLTLPKKGGEPPKFSAHVYCGQTAEWMKVVLGMEVGLSTGDFVLDGDPVLPPQQRGRNPLPIFGPFLLCPNGWMHQDATGYGGWR